jgi:predicted transcriptional regulator
VKSLKVLLSKGLVVSKKLNKILIESMIKTAKINNVLRFPHGIKSQWFNANLTPLGKCPNIA